MSSLGCRAACHQLCQGTSTWLSKSQQYALPLHMCMYDALCMNTPIYSVGWLEVSWARELQHNLNHLEKMVNFSLMKWKKFAWWQLTVTSHLPISQLSPWAPCTRHVPTALFCSTKESCTPRGHRATTFSRLYFASDIIWMLMEWYCLWLKKGNASEEGALVRTCVWYIAPTMLGNPAVAWKFLLICTCPTCSILQQAAYSFTGDLLTVELGQS